MYVSRSDEAGVPFERRKTPAAVLPSIERLPEGQLFSGTRTCCHESSHFIPSTIHDPALDWLCAVTD